MHGGDVYRNHVELDFSVNVNPLGVPREVMKAMERSLSQITAYPDPACEKLREKIGEHFECDKGRILCGNGASELLLAICRWRAPKKAFLLAPGFSGYERALRSIGCSLEYFDLDKEQQFSLSSEAPAFLESIRRTKPELLFLANPANPAGTLAGKETLREIARVCQEMGTAFVLDECFMELTNRPEEHSMTGEIQKFPNLMILRAFTKSFALPGIRLGYLLCGESIPAEELTGQLPEWNVSLPAQSAGLAALDQEKYLAMSRDLIKRERSYLASKLEELGAEVFPSEANFLLFYCKDEGLYKELLRQGILIRDCRDYRGLGPGYFRVAVRGHEENEILIQNVAKRLDQRSEVECPR